MKTARVMIDGKVAVFQVPDNATESDVESFIQQNGAKLRAQHQIANDPITKGAQNFNADASGFDKFFAGAGKAVADTGRGLGQVVGLVSEQDVSESRQRDAPLMDTGEGTIGNIAGHVATMLLPGGIMKGAGKAAKIPWLQVAGQQFMAPSMVKTALPIGTVTGAVAPAESWEERLRNVGLGAGATAAVPAVLNTASGIKAALQPRLQSGREAIVGRILNEASGGERFARDAAQRLSTAQPKIPGSYPTIGQASGNEGLAALERTVRQTNPTAGNMLGERFREQALARSDFLDDLAGEGGRRARITAARSAKADEMYRVARDAGIDLSQLSPARKGEITKLLQRPAIQDALKDARRMALNEFQKVKDPAGSVKGLDYLRRALNDQIGSARGNEQRILIGLRERLDKTLESLSPEYMAANRAFRKMSGPVTRLDVTAAINQMAREPVNRTIQPTRLARALSNNTARSVTGMRGATLEGAVGPRYTNALNALMDDMRSAQFAQNAGRGGSDTIQKAAYSSMMERAGMPTWMRNAIVSQVAGPVGAAAVGAADKALEASATRAINELLATATLNPQIAARLMQSGRPNAILDLLGRSALYAGPLGMSAPYLNVAEQ